MPISLTGDSGSIPLVAVLPSRRKYMKADELWKGLDEEILMRLCDCRSRQSDILPLARCVYKNKHMTDKVSALIYVLEHLECNMQYFDLTNDEWNAIIEQM
jgi:hypothetical protein